MELPAELLYAILTAAGRQLLSRQLSRQLSILGSQLVDHLCLTQSADAAAVKALVGWCTGLKSLDLTQMREGCVDDELLAWTLEAHPALEILDVSSSGGQLTSRTLAMCRSIPSLRLRAEGCWRMHEAHPSLSPREVVAVQIQALRGDAGSGEGIAACFRFASPANRQHTGPVMRFVHMIRRGYSCMLRSQTARVAWVAGGLERDTH